MKISSCGSKVLAELIPAFAKLMPKRITVKFYYGNKQIVSNIKKIL